MSIVESHLRSGEDIVFIVTPQPRARSRALYNLSANNGMVAYLQSSSVCKN